jgi:hypothetical protein
LSKGSIKKQVCSTKCSEAANLVSRKHNVNFEACQNCPTHLCSWKYKWIPSILYHTFTFIPRAQSHWTCILKGDHFLFIYFFYFYLFSVIKGTTWVQSPNSFSFFYFFLFLIRIIYYFDLKIHVYTRKSIFFNWWTPPPFFFFSIILHSSYTFFLIMWNVYLTH